MTVKSVSCKNDPGDQRACQPDAHSQEIEQFCNNHFSVKYWTGDYTDHCITFTILLQPY
jgi:hypothetical protein